MVKKMAPRNVRVCPVCPNNDLSLDVSPQFNFSAPNKETKKITIIDHVKNKLQGKVSSLF